jgi:hypothetical protein
MRRIANLAGFGLLAAFTVYGVLEFASGNWRSALGYWEGQLPVLPAVLALAAADVAFEALAVLCAYARFGVRAFDRQGAVACLSIRAGLLLPAQLGRVIRPDALARLGKGAIASCLKAEGAAFVLDTLSVVALVAGLLAWRWQPLAAPLVAVAVVAAALGAGRFFSGWLAGTRFELPADFWWRWSTFGIVALEGLAWITHGMAFWLLVRGLSASVTAVDATLATAGASLLGAGSGAPGGVGVIDGLLGASLRWMDVPAEHLAFAVGGFRLATFWLWIPVGWGALALTRRVPRPVLEVATERP